MSHNARVRSASPWVGVLLPNEFNGLAVGIRSAINGDGGGVWSPNTPIEIDGSFGVSVTGPAFFGDIEAITVSSGATFAIAGELDILGTVNVPSTGRMIFQSGSTALLAPGANSSFDLRPSGLVTFGNTSILTFGLGLLGEPNCTWSGAPTFVGSSGVTFGSAAGLVFGTGTSLATANAVTQLAGGSAVFAGVTHFGSGVAVNQSGPRTLLGPNAGIAWRRALTIDGAATYDASKDSYRVPAVSSAVTYTIAHSGAGGTVVASSGMRLHFFQLHGAVGPVLKTEAGATIVASTAPPWWADLYFDGTGWALDTSGGGGFTDLS